MGDKKVNNEIVEEATEQMKSSREETRKLIRYMVNEAKDNTLDYVNNSLENKYVDRIIYSFSNEKNVEYINYIKSNIIKRNNLFVELRRDEIDTITFMEQVSKYNVQFKESRILFDVEYFSLTDLERDKIKNLRLYCFKENIIKGIVFFPDSIYDKKVFYKDILDSGNNDLIQNVNENINLFISDTLLKYSVIEESESSFVKLVNTAYLNNINGQFNKLLIKFQGVISDLESIDNKLLLRDTLIQKKCKITWKNLHHILGFEDIEVEDIDAVIDVFSESNNVQKLTNPQGKDLLLAMKFYQIFQERVTINNEGSDKIIFVYPNASEYEDEEYKIGIITKLYEYDTISVKSEDNNLIDLFQTLKDSFTV